MTERHMAIDETLLDEDGEWPEKWTFELEDGETRSYQLIPDDR